MKHKIASLLVLLLLIAGGGATLAPREADAFLPVIDPTNLIQNTISAAYAGKSLLNPIFYRIAQTAIQSMVRSTVKWINSGFNGSPAFVTDIHKTLLDASDAEAQRFLREITSSSAINSPFKTQISQAVLQSYYLSTSRDGFALQNPYTLNKIAKNDRAFLAGDFSQGGFHSWFATVLNQQNNPIGAQILFENELNNRVAAAQGQLHEELGWGNGFLSWRTCDTPAPSSSGCAAGEVDTQDGSGCQPSGTVDLAKTNTCLASHIETPGSVIASSLNKQLGLGADSLVNAKEFDEIVNALLGQLMNNVLGGGGLGGLSRGSAATGGRAYFDQTTTSASTNVSAGVSVVSSFTTILDQQTAQLQGYLANWQTISAAANAAKNALQSTTCLNQAQVQALMDAQVTPTITRAATIIGTVPGQLSAIDKIRTEATNAVTVSAGDQTTVLSQASAEYQNLLPSLPSIGDITDAQTQATDSGTATPVSLLTQLNNIAAQAKCAP